MRHPRAERSGWTEASRCLHALECRRVLTACGGCGGESRWAPAPGAGPREVMEVVVQHLLLQHALWVMEKLKRINALAASVCDLRHVNVNVRFTCHIL